MCKLHASRYIEYRYCWEDKIIPEINFELTFQIGPLEAGFRVNLEGNYIVLVGPNNAAKTSILQAIFRTRVPYDASQNTSDTKS